MTYRTVLTVLDSETTSERVATMAAMLAKSQESHLIGLHAIPAPVVHPTFGVQFPSEILKVMQARGVERAATIKQSFDAAVAREGHDNIEWRSPSLPTAYLTDEVLDHARRADLVIVGQADTNNPGGARSDLAGSLVLEAGRPVLVIPYARTATDFGKIVLIAWDGSREAARAAFDAMPLLKAAKEVHVLVIDPDNSAPDNPRLPGAELATALARHGVKAIAESTTSDGMKKSDVLLSRMADRGADLLVMGGYGRSRARERIFGGVTHNLLNAMTEPVLFSN